MLYWSKLLNGKTTWKCLYFAAYFLRTGKLSTALLQRVQINLALCSSNMLSILLTQASDFRSKKPNDSSRNSLKSSKISIFKKRFSKCGSEVIPATFTSQATAPGQLCLSQAGADSPHPFPGLRPVNRLRSTSSVLQCSRCTSVLSVAASRMTSRATSQMSLLLDRKYARLPSQVQD